jgi:hypothetical protein
MPRALDAHRALLAGDVPTYHPGVACLDENTLAAYFDLKLSAEETMFLFAHVDACAACAEQFADCGRAFAAQARRVDVAAPTTPGAPPVGRSRPDRPVGVGWTGVAGAAQGAEVEPLPYPVGARLGRYEIDGILGVGGMGVVYAGRDPGLNRRVAIKLLRPNADGAATSLRARLAREAQAMARLSHPNVINVFEIDAHGEQVFVVMELIDGVTLRNWLREKERSWREIVRVFVAAGQGLAAAHAAGIVHRDFKPDNVLVAFTGKVAVTDFGLARMGADDIEPSASPASPAAALDATRTFPGRLVGTPGYMAPEQLRGQPAEVGSDVFSFCVSLYEALCGGRPYYGRSLAELGVQMGAGPPEIPRTRRVPSWLHRIVARGLAPRPEDRFGSMDELLGRLRRPPRRRVLVLAGSAVLFLGASVTIVAGAVLGGRPAAIASPPCPPLDLGAAEVWVDASATRAGSGVKDCPYRTVSDALAAVEGSHAHHTIHVAAGTYDQVLGERFPLVVRGDLAIHGAGDQATFVVGTARYSGEHNNVGAVDATIVIGDPRATTELAGIAVASGTAEPEHDFYGVVCDRGNLGRVDAEALPEPSTRLRDISIGPGYNTAVTVAQSGQLGGCNLGLVRATLRRSHVGVWTVGCGARSVPDAAVAARIEASSFTDMRAAEASGGIGVAAWDCTVALAVEGSRFADDDTGIFVVAHKPPRRGLVVRGSWLSSLTRAGIALHRAAYVEELVDTTIIDVSPGPAALAAPPGVGLLIDQSQNPVGSPGVRSARGNAITNNDVGILIRGETPFGGVLDFGRRDDPGRNTIRCNATQAGLQAAGHDLEIAAPIGRGARLLFAGDTWDNTPPTTGATNGADVLALAETALDTTGAVAATGGCSRGAP